MTDVKDKRILAELDRDSRISLSRLGKRVGLSQQVVSYRLANLEKRGVIEGYFTVLGLSKLGYESYRIMLSLTNADEKKMNEIINYLKEYDNILWLVSVGGRWDLFIDIIARSNVDFERRFRAIRQRFPDQFQNYQIITIIDVIGFGRKYLFDKDVRRQPISFEIESEAAECDETNCRILSLLSTNARIPIKEISQRLRINPLTVRNRMKAMVKNGIIQNYKPLLILERIGVEAYKILIKLQNTTIEEEKRLIGFAQFHKNIPYVIKTIGPWDIELELEVESSRTLQQTSLDLRNRFKDIIKEIEIVQLYRDHMYNYFPRDLV